MTCNVERELEDQQQQTDHSQHEQEFMQDAHAIMQFLNKSIISLFAHLKNEAELLGLEVPVCTLNEGDLEDLVVKVLPHTIDEETVYETNENVTRVATEFLSILKSSAHLMFDKKTSEKQRPKYRNNRSDNLRHRCGKRLINFEKILMRQNINMWF